MFNHSEKIDILLQATGIVSGAILSDVSTIAAIFCYSATGIFTSIKIYAHFRTKKKNDIESAEKENEND